MKADYITKAIEDTFERLSRSLLDTLEGNRERRTAKIPGGEMTISLTPEQATAWDADSDAAAAKRFGLSPDQYAAWVSLDGAPRCGASTEVGPCSNLVGPNQLSAREWLDAHHSVRCPKHGKQLSSVA